MCDVRARWSERNYILMRQWILCVWLMAQWLMMCGCGMHKRTNWTRHIQQSVNGDATKAWENVSSACVIMWMRTTLPDDIVCVSARTRSNRSELSAKRKTELQVFLFRSNVRCLLPFVRHTLCGSNFVSRRRASSLPLSPCCQFWTLLWMLSFVFGDKKNSSAIIIIVIGARMHNQWRRHEDAHTRKKGERRKCARQIETIVGSDGERRREWTSRTQWRQWQRHCSPFANVWNTITVFSVRMVAMWCHRQSSAVTTKWYENSGPAVKKMHSPVRRQSPLQSFVYSGLNHIVMCIFFMFCLWSTQAVGFVHCSDFCASFSVF